MANWGQGAMYGNPAGQIQGAFGTLASLFQMNAQYEMEQKRMALAEQHRAEQADMEKKRLTMGSLDGLVKIFHLPKNQRNALLPHYIQQIGTFGVKVDPALVDVMKATSDQQAASMRQIFSAMGTELDPDAVVEAFGDVNKAMEFGFKFAEQQRANKSDETVRRLLGPEGMAPPPSPDVVPPEQRGLDTSNAAFFSSPAATQPMTGDQHTIQGPALEDRTMLSGPHPLSVVPPAMERPEQLRMYRDKLTQALVSASDKGKAALTARIAQLDADLKALESPQEVSSELGKLQRDYDLLRKQGVAADSPVMQAIQRKIQAAGAGTNEAQSPVGKVGDDLARAESLYGRESVQFKALEQALAGGGEPPKLSDVNSLRNTFVQQSRDFIAVRDGYQRIKAAASNPSAVGDIALIFGFMKIIDPGSTVREGEFATAEQAQGIPSRILNLYNKAVSGERLSDVARKDFLGQAEKLYRAQENTHKALEGQFRSIAKRQGMNPDDVVVQFRVDGGATTVTLPDGTKATIERVP